jgi:DtxR family Mn-dependent transcriptional regulator
MPNDVWKEFEENMITHSAAHYLMTIHELLEEQGYARVTDIAKRLNITRGSCSISLRPLKKRLLVLEDANRFLLLSDEGKRIAEMIERNDQLLEKLFHDVLKVSRAQAEIDACKIEHLLSIETSMRLAQFIDQWESDDDQRVASLKNLLEKQSPGCERSPEDCSFCKGICLMEHDNSPA